MNTLAIETTELVGTVAAACDGQILLAESLDPEMRSARSLAPALKDLLEKVAWRPTDVDLVAVTQGPGSFTGLRVGIATAKTFAYSAQADVLGVNTLHAIAEQVPAEVSKVSVAVDAQRGQVVSQIYHREENGHLQATEDSKLQDATAWLESIGPNTWISGPILRRKLNLVPEGVTVVDESCWAPRADSVARIAQARYQAGERDDLWKLLPAYSRKSAAEEKWEAKQQD